MNTGAEEVASNERMQEKELSRVVLKGDIPVGGMCMYFCIRVYRFMHTDMCKQPC